MTVAAKTGAAGTYTITVTPPTADDGWVNSTPAYKVKAVLTRLSSITVLSSVTLTVNVATCNCDALVWESPAVVT